MPFVTFPKRLKDKLGIAVISIVAVALVSSSGLLSPIIKLMGQAVGVLKLGVQRVLGIAGRKQA